MLRRKFWIKGIIQRQTMHKAQPRVAADGDVSALLRPWSEGDYKRMQWQDRAHFFAVSSQLMRCFPVGRTRCYGLKHGGGAPHVSLEEAAVVGRGRPTDFAALDDAMSSLARFDARKAHKAHIVGNALFRWAQHRRDGGSAQGSPQGRGSIVN